MSDTTRAGLIKKITDARLSRENASSKALEKTDKSTDKPETSTSHKPLQLDTIHQGSSSTTMSTEQSHILSLAASSRAYGTSGFQRSSDQLGTTSAFQRSTSISIFESSKDLPISQNSIMLEKQEDAHVLDSRIERQKKDLEESIRNRHYATDHNLRVHDEKTERMKQSVERKYEIMRRGKRWIGKESELASLENREIEKLISSRDKIRKDLEDHLRKEHEQIDRDGEQKMKNILANKRYTNK